MTTSSDRILLRWVPLAALLAAAMAVGLSFGPHPFGFHSWPKPPAQRSVDRVVRVAPDGVRDAVARREPADRSSSRQSTVPTHDQGAGTRRVPHRGQGGAPAPRRSSSRHGGSGEGPAPTPAPVQVPEPPTGDPVAEIPDGVPVAEVPESLPNGAEAKPDALPAPSVEVRDDFDHYEVYEAAGHRQRYGGGRKGRHGRH